MSTNDEPSVAEYEDVGQMNDPRLLDVSGVDFGAKKPVPGRQYLKASKRQRSAYWDHFWEYEDDKRKRRVECKFCDCTYGAETTAGGTRHLREHSKKCLLNPSNKGKVIVKGKQSELCFTSEGSCDLGFKDPTVDLVELRAAIGEMIIVDELPFNFVEKHGFRKVMSIACPRFKVPSRTTITSDCMKMYFSLKKYMYQMLQKSCQGICVTTDTWTSNQRINYMCLTGHFIDENWKLQKRVLNFCPVSSHKGEAIGRAIEECLRHWGLMGKLITVTVDNASSNDTACAYLKTIVRKEGGGDANFLHMRCVAHIVNLIVWDGLKEHVTCIDKVRSAIKHIKHSPARLLHFKDLVGRMQIDSKSLLKLDCPTRWNSTFTMLETAVKFKDVFSRIDLPIEYVKDDNGDLVALGTLNTDDWDKLEHLVHFLREFYELTINVSGSLYVTSNLLFFHIAHTYTLLNKWKQDENLDFCNMAHKMKQKFDKYWGDLENMNMMMYLAVVLDPNLKLVGLKMPLSAIYGEIIAERLTTRIKEFAIDLFERYQIKYGKQVNVGRAAETSVPTAPSQATAKKDCSGINLRSSWVKQVADLGGAYFSFNELELYLEEKKGVNEDDDVLQWWLVHGPRYPVLSKMARDVLALPISTVASESTFSTGGRTLDQFRSSLTPKTVQALICAQDWIRSAYIRPKMHVEEDLEKLEEVEKVVEEELQEEEEVVFVD